MAGKLNIQNQNTNTMIARDGARISLWQDMPVYKQKNVPIPADEFDVAIVGGGITGITTAYRLQQSGKKCILLEAYTLGFGTTGGTTAHLNTLLDTPYNTIIQKFNTEAATHIKDATEDAIEFIRTKVKDYQIDCGFRETSAFLMAQNNDQEKQLDEIIEGCRAVCLDYHVSSSAPLPLPVLKSIEVKGQASFHPLRYLYALAEKFEEFGGVILQNHAVTDHEETDQYWRLKTSSGFFHAKAVVYATHIPPGINLMHLRCAPWRSYAMAVTLADERDYPTVLGYDLYDPYHYYRTHEIDGKKYLIAGGEDHKSGQCDNTELNFLHLESHLRTYFNIKEINHRWSSQYFESSDGLPYIGHVPGMPNNIYVATGFGGNGMIYGTIAARLLCNLLTGKDDVLIDLLTPARLKPVAGFTNFAGHNADVVKEWIGGLLSRSQLEELADLAPGEGKIVKYENESLALSKDQKGAVHAVHPLCTHMKCTVAWNTSEQSWECPCHGARYAQDGQVITAPANRALRQVISSDEKITMELSAYKDEKVYGKNTD